MRMETILTYEERICQCDFIWERFEKISWVLKITPNTNFKMRISEGQKDKLKKAFESNWESITIRVMFSDLHGEDVIALTNSQLDRLVKAYEVKKGMTIRMSKTQLAHYMKIDGGFLPALAGLIPFLTGTVWPAIGVWALTGLASTGVQKRIGNELHLKKDSAVCRIETDGEGLYLVPTKGKWFETVGKCHYLMKQGGFYDGRGLILDPNSPLKISQFFALFCNNTFRKKILYTITNGNWGK